MTPTLIAAVAAVAAQAHARPSLAAAQPPGLACMSNPESRDLAMAQKLIAPARAVGVAMRDGGGELVAIRLCRGPDEILVYDVTVLRRDGRLVHVPVDAHSGEPWVFRR